MSAAKAASEFSRANSASSWGSSSSDIHQVMSAGRQREQKISGKNVERRSPDRRVGGHGVGPSSGGARWKGQEIIGQFPSGRVCEFCGARGRAHSASDPKNLFPAAHRIVAEVRFDKADSIKIKQW